MSGAISLRIVWTVWWQKVNNTCNVMWWCSLWYEQHWLGLFRMVLNFFCKRMMSLVWLFLAYFSEFSEIYISQSSVATRFRCDGIFNNVLVQIFRRVRQPKNFLKSVSILWSYDENMVVYFFHSLCRGSKFGLSHRNEVSPLTQGLNYRSACDIRGGSMETDLKGTCSKFGEDLSKAELTLLSIDAKRIPEGQTKLKWIYIWCTCTYIHIALDRQ